MSLTERAEDMIYSMIEEYRSINRDISHLKDDSDKLIEYLNDIRITITPAYALKRLICDKHAIEYDGTKNKYILDIKDKENFIEVDNYDDNNCPNDSYITALVMYAKQNNVPITKQNASNWFEKSYTRYSFFKIAFALQLNSDEVQSYLIKELGEHGYNFKSCEEIVYWFCATYIEYNKYDEALSILSEIEDKLFENITPESIETEYYQSILSNISKKEDLINVIVENKEHFFFYSDTENIKPRELSEEEKKEYKEKQKLIRENKEFYLSSQKSRKHFCALLDEAKELFSIATGEEYNNEKLAYTIWDGIPREGKILNDQKRNTDSSSMGEYVSLKGSALPEQITQNILIRDRMDSLSSGKIAVTRKDIITISYFVMTIKVEMALSGDYFNTKYGEELRHIASNISEDKPYYNMKFFQDEINLILDDLGFAPLYAPNRFDNIILLSTLSAEPAQFFSDIIETAILSSPVVK